jgi:hypothetical protein
MHFAMFYIIQPVIIFTQIKKKIILKFLWNWLICGAEFCSLFSIIR